MNLSGKHQRITEVLQDYWQQKRKGHAIPEDADIDPKELGELWEHCFLVQKLPGDSYQYVHMGSAIIEAYGDDLTGSEICKKLVGKLHEPLVKKFNEALATNQPVLDENVFINTRQMEVKYRGCFLPLQGKRADQRYVLGGMKWKAY
jgi:hypothetical protein